MAANNQFDFDGATLAAHERFDAYGELYSAGCDVDRGDGRFGARITGWRLDRSLLYDRRLRGVAHRRDAARVRRDAMAHVTLTLAVSGEFHADAGDGYRRLAPGEVLLLDMTRPMRNRAAAAHVVTLSMPRDRIARLVGEPRELHGRVIAAGQAALLADHLRALVRFNRRGTGPLPHPATHQDTAVGGRVGERAGAVSAEADQTPPARAGLDLLAGALAVDAARERPLDAAAERIERVRAHIEERLFEPGFGPDAVMARFALSRATLYRDFQPWGGLASYIRGRRTELLRERLADRDETRPLADLAELLGFSTEARLSEAFRARFGMRPGAFRTMARQETAPARALRRMREWQNVLR